MSKYKGRKPRKRKPLKPSGFYTTDDNLDTHATMKMIYKSSTGKETIYFYGFDYQKRRNMVTSWRGKRRPKDQYGWSPVNAFTLVKRENHLGYGFIKYGLKASTATREYSGAVFPYFFSQLRYLPNITSEALQSKAESCASQAVLQAYEKANAPDINGAVQIAELDESLRQLAKSGLQAKRLKDNLSKGKPGKLGKTLKKNAKGFGDPKTHADLQTSAWLRFRYGLSPIAFTVKDIIEYLYKGAKQRKKYSGEVMIGENFTDYFTRRVDVVDIVIRRDVTTRIQGNCILYPSNQRDRIKDPDFGFKPWDLISAGWERTPYSFVADWFFNVGDWIAAYRPGGAVIAHQSTTVLIEVVEEFSLDQTQTISSSWWADVEMSNFTKKSLYIVRRDAIERPLLPGLNAEYLSWERKADAVSLIYKLLGKGRK